jgi:DNA-binding response OmpR family regulator
MSQRILIVEDDAALRRILKDNFSADGFDVQSAADAHQAIARAQSFAPDLVLLDLMLPGASGFDVCTALRGRRHTPIIILSARNERRDKLRGLNLGADDYITKPFDLQELLARVHAVLRRSSPPVRRLSLGGVTIDLVSLQAWQGAERIEFSHREFELLKYLAERPHKMVSRGELLREVWGYPEAPNTRSVDHAISRLRRKIEPDTSHPRYIHTVHGDGYCLTPD